MAHILSGRVGEAPIISFRHTVPTTNTPFSMRNLHLPLPDLRPASPATSRYHFHISSHYASDRSPNSRFYQGRHLSRDTFNCLQPARKTLGSSLLEPQIETSHTFHLYDPERLQNRCISDSNHSIFVHNLQSKKRQLR